MPLAVVWRMGSRQTFHHQRDWGELDAFCIVPLGTTSSSVGVGGYSQDSWGLLLEQATLKF